MGALPLTAPTRTEVARLRGCVRVFVLDLIHTLRARAVVGVLAPLVAARAANGARLPQTIESLHVPSMAFCGRTLMPLAVRAVVDERAPIGWPRCSNGS